MGGYMEVSWVGEKVVRRKGEGRKGKRRETL